MEPQAISASYIAELIEVNEQALASFKARKKICDEDKYSATEWTRVFRLASTLDEHLEALKEYHTFLVAKEDTEHLAERMTKSNSAINTYIP